MTGRLALFAAALVWALTSPGAAAAAAAAAAKKDKPAATPQAPAKGEKATSKAGKAADKAKKPEEPSTIVMDGQPAGEDPEFAKAGKVIEFDGSGKAKVVRGSDTGADVPQGHLVGEELPPPMEEREGQPLGRPGKEGAGAATGKGPNDLTAKEACKLRLGAQCKMLVRCTGGAFPLDCEQMAAGCEQAEGMAAYSRKDAEACAKGIASLSCDTVNAMGLDFDPEAKVAACKPVKEAEGGKPAPKKVRGVPGTGQDFRDLDVDLGGALGGGSSGLE